MILASWYGDGIHINLVPIPPYLLCSQVYKLVYKRGQTFLVQECLYNTRMLNRKDQEGVFAKLLPQRLAFPLNALLKDNLEWFANIISKINFSMSVSR